MNANHFISQPSLSFLSLQDRKLQSNIWNDLRMGLWKDFQIESFLWNDKLSPVDKYKQKALFPSILQIEPGLVYNTQNDNLCLDLYTPNKTTANLDRFIEEAEIFFKSLNAKRIGVHLSGGLDSSIIMALLHKLNIPFVPIGLVSETFEFRTERAIQEKLLDWGEDGLLISMEEYPFYSDIKELPAHQIPCSIFKGYAGSKALAKAFQARGCDVVLTGQGGDSLFVEEVNDLKKLQFNINDEFKNLEEADLIYSPLGIRLISFYSSHIIIDIISNARLGGKDDPLKIWTRQWIKDLLISELTNYSYYADFFGLTMWGLHQARTVIKELLEEACDITNKTVFSPHNINKFLSQDIFSFEYNDYIQFCSLISIAVWYHSLMREI